MGHRKLRTASVLAASVALVVATAAPTRAQEAPAGVGSSSGSATVLDVLLGDGALDLRLLGEDSDTTNDPASGGPSALERVTPLAIVSSLVPALGGASQPTIETSSTSGEDSASTPGVDLGSALAGLPVPGLLDGTIDPVALRSLVDANGALSGATAAVRDLSVLGGLVGTGTAEADLGSAALLSDASALRGLQLDSLEVLDLQALLDLLGISLADLPLVDAVGLLDGLGLPLPAGFTDPAALLAQIDGLLDQSGPVRQQVTALQGQIDSAQAQLAPLTTQLQGLTSSKSALEAQIASLQAELGGLSCALLPVLCGQIATAQATLADVQAQITSVTGDITDLDGLVDTLQAQIEDLLDTIDALLDDLLGLVEGVLEGLEGASLLSVEDLVVGLTARADETVDSSEAAVVGSVGDVTIGGLSLGGLDAGAALGQVTSLADQLTGTLSGLLGGIDPALAGLVDVDLLDQATSVTESGGVTTALAEITALRATITPPDVCALLGRLGAQETLGDVLGGLGQAIPSLPGPVGDVLGDLGSTVTCQPAASAGGLGTAALVDGVASALTQPLTIEALSLSGAASYAVPATPGAPGTPGTPGQTPTPGSLPRTGGDAQLALLAVAAGAVAYGMRRLLARSA